MTESIPSWKPVLALLMRLLWAAVLVLWVFGARAGVVFTTLYSFTGTNDGANPQAGLVQGSDGNFYGTTIGGGTNGNGTVFKINTNGALTTLHSFTGNDGANPQAGLVQGSDGNFYGTTIGGGTNGNGTVFKISTNGTLTTLYAFGSTTNADGEPLDGAYPIGGLVQGRDGNFYGTTSGGGTYGYNSLYPHGYGTVFKVTTNGVLTTLYAFGSITNAEGGSVDGAYPIGGLVQGRDGNFYGTTSGGGTYNFNFSFGDYGDGTAFKISTNGVLTTLHVFGAVFDASGVSVDGVSPFARLVQGTDGYFYGTTTGGGYAADGHFYGSGGYGTVFKMTANGALTTLASFGRTHTSPLTGSGIANNPSQLLQGSDGSFYGINMYVIEENGPVPYGVLFNVSTNGTLTGLYRFPPFYDGVAPAAGLVLGSDGSFYGTTPDVGLYGGSAGTVFRLSIVPDPQLTIIPSDPYIILTWRTNYGAFSYAGYTLQSTTNLGSWAVWSTNSSSPVVIGGQNVVVNPVSGTQQFFRLSQ